MKVQKIDMTAERNFITSLIVSTEVCKAVGQFDVSLLKTDYARIVAQWASTYFEKYGTAINRDIQKEFEEHRKEIQDEEYYDSIADFLSRLSKDFENGAPNSEAYSIDSAYKYLKGLTHERFLRQLQDARENNEDLDGVIAAFQPYVNPSMLLKIYTGNDVLAAEFPETNFIVEGFLAVGLAFFAGAPKIGKSWATLQICSSVASGRQLFGKFRTEKTKVLYLALEDSEKRLHERLNLLKARNLKNLNITNDWRRGIQANADLRMYLENNPDTKLVCIDTFGCFRDVPKSRNIYQGEYDEIRSIKKIADEFQICILLVHHTNKPGRDGRGQGDIIDSLNGTTGLGGAADQVLVMRRGRKSDDGTLFMTSRDIPEVNLAIHWDLGWSVMGDAEEYEMTKEQRKILMVLKESDEPMRPGEIAKIVETSQPNVSKLLAKMAFNGIITSPKYGWYSAGEE